MIPLIENNIIKIGFTSRLGMFISKYPWRAMLISFAILEIVLIIIEPDTTKIRQSFVGLLTFYSIFVLIMQLSLRAWCYKIEIDRRNNHITLFRFFNRGVHQFEIKNISIVIGYYCNIFLNGARFVIHAAFIHDLVAYLPSDTIIEYRGRVGKYKGKEWEKNGRPLIPGNRL